MRSAPFHCAMLLTSLTLLCIIQFSRAQVVGCDGSGITCPTKDSATDTEIYRLSDDGIGIVSFDSNVTSDGPLTWTVNTHDGKFGNDHASFRFPFLGSPPSLNFEEVSDYQGCVIPFWKATSALQLPSASTNLATYGCPTVMGPSCAQQIVDRVRSELVSVVNDPSFDPLTQGRPCGVVWNNLKGTDLPESCAAAFNETKFSFGRPRIITNNTNGTPDIYQRQDGCTVTTGGSGYNMVEAPDEYLEGNSNSDEIKLFKTGSSPLLTLFYNEPGSGASTLLAEPEVHLSCVKPVTSTKEQESGAARSLIFSRPTTAALVVSGLMWVLNIV